MTVAKFAAAAYARTLTAMERDRFAAIALRARDPHGAIAAFERQRRRAR